LLLLIAYYLSINLYSVAIHKWQYDFTPCRVLRPTSLGQIPVKANLFSFAWGIAQVLALLCFVRIGVSLTYGILCAIGASVGVITPMIIKATGIFSQAPGLFSPAGMTVMGGVLVMVLGVYLASLSGFQREKTTQEGGSAGPARDSGGFRTGLIMVIIAGILSAGWGFAFAYSQGPIVEIMTDHGAADLPSKIAVWAFVLVGAGIVNTLYPAYLLTKNRSWKVISGNGREILLCAAYGLLFFIPSVLLGKGMLHEMADQSRLASACLARDETSLAHSRQSSVKARPQVAQFMLATNKCLLVHSQAPP